MLATRSGKLLPRGEKGRFMLASDYIVHFLRQKGITNVFGYPGGMVTYLMDSLDRCEDAPSAHICYHEQACSMAACGWSEVTHLPGVAYATSGPGATNLLTGIACAYFESLPAIFITGQVNTYEMKGALSVRQRGFQETDIVSMAKPITKMAVCVEEPSFLPKALEQAFQMAMEGRPGPVLLDIPMNVQRADIEPKGDVQIAQPKHRQDDPVAVAKEIAHALKAARCPLILAGHGIRTSGQRTVFRQLVRQTGIPVVTSMIAVDMLPTDDPCMYGFIGAYGARHANWIVNHCDLLLVLGSRLDCRQTGVNKLLFAPEAKLYRVDVDEGELTNRIRDDERQFTVKLEDLLPALVRETKGTRLQLEQWTSLCVWAQKRLNAVDAPNPGNEAAKQLSALAPAPAYIVTDVGQNQVWIAQSFSIRSEQSVLFSGGHGAMGYALPAAIGASLASPKTPVLCCTGDGGLQMNLQELQTVVREHLPIKIVLFNNRALGMIHHFQEMYFNSNYAQTEEDKGFSTPDFCAVARAYGWRVAHWGEQTSAVLAQWLADDQPLFLEIALPQTTHVFPKLGLNKPIHEQEPSVDPGVFAELEEKLACIQKKAERGNQYE